MSDGNGMKAHFHIIGQMAIVKHMKKKIRMSKTYEITKKAMAISSKRCNGVEGYEHSWNLEKRRKR